MKPLSKPEFKRQDTKEAFQENRAEIAEIILELNAVAHLANMEAPNYFRMWMLKNNLQDLLEFYKNKMLTEKQKEES